MKIEVKRLYKKANYTIGKIYVDGQYISDTLEDTDRGLTQDMPNDEIAKKKVFGKTAIPSGEYDVTLSVISPKFGKMPYYKEVCGGRLPRLLSVPGFYGVLIHVGAAADNTEGCILVGYNKQKGRLVDGKEAFKKLYGKIKEAKGIKIDIR